MFKFLRKKMREQITVMPEEIKIEEIDFSKERGLKMSISHPLFYNLTCEIVRFFKESGGQNFVSMTAYSEEIGMFDLIIQRHDGKRAEWLVFELKNRIAELEKQLKDPRHRWKEVSHD
jgi:hypothetical protein